MSKLDPKLELLLQERDDAQKRALDRGQPFEAGGPPTASPQEAAPETIAILVKFAGELVDLQALGFQSEAVAGNIAAGRARLDDVPAIASHPNVIKIEMSHPLFRDLDQSVTSIHANTLHSGTPVFKGNGVIVGVIDSGIDYQHGCFRKADETSRILSIWDMDPPTGVVGSPPTGFTVGIEYTKAQLDAALATSTPLTTVNTTDDDLEDGHGTHVAGIAAGNGRPEGNCRVGGTFVGVAPEADLIIVKLASDNQELGESMNLTLAVDYIFRKAQAESKPAVINISQGDNMGAHDGTSLVEQFIDLQLLLEDGRAVVKSAGNEANKSHHARGTITAGGSQDVDVQFTVPADHTGRLMMDVWYEGADRFDVTITPPTGAGSGTVTPGNSISNSALANNNTISINSQLNDPDNNDNRIFIEIRRGTAAVVEPGTWTMNLTATTLTDGDFDAWIERGSNTAVFEAPHVTIEGTVSIPGTARRVITVGAFADRGLGSGNLTDFSSRGPARDSVTKPEIVAPGFGILSSRSSSMPSQPACIALCADRYHPLPGTSMSAPHVAGVVALMLQKNRSLAIEDIRRHLFDTTTKDAGHMGALPNSNWGNGIVNAAAAVAAVSAPQPFMMDRPESETSTGKLGGSLSEPGMSGAAITLTPLPDSPAPVWQTRQNELLQTGTGRMYAALIGKHFSEVRELIRTNRHVTAVWLRNHGPQIMRSLLYGAYSPLEPLFSEIEDQPISACIQRILDTLRSAGSPALQADIEQYSPSLMELTGLSFNELVARFRAADAGAAD